MNKRNYSRALPERRHRNASILLALCVTHNALLTLVKAPSGMTALRRRSGNARLKPSADFYHGNVSLWSGDWRP